MGPIDILVLSYQRGDFTKKTIEYLWARTKSPFRLIVVDNKSDDGIREWLVEQHWKGKIHQLTLLDKNYGVHAGKNVGLAQIISPYFVDTDNDILVPDLEPDWLSQLYSLIKARPDYGAISLRPQILVGRSGRDFEGHSEVAPFNHIGAHMRIMKTEAMKKGGGWKPTWDSKRNDEDHWSASILHEQDLKVGYATDLRCWHCFGENWGYGDMPIEEHGHREVWPPVEAYDKIEVHAKTFRPL